LFAALIICCYTIPVVKLRSSYRTGATPLG